MGWSGATDLFDGAVDVALMFIPNSDHNLYRPLIVKAVVEAMYTKIYWDDWDTQDESKYAEYLKEIRIELGEIDEDDVND